MWPKFVPTFEPITTVDAGHIVEHPTTSISAPHIAVEPHGANHVRITIGGITKTVDGISLCNIVNEAIAAARRGPRL